MALPISTPKMPVQLRKPRNAWIAASCLLGTACATAGGTTDSREELSALRQAHEADQKKIRALEAQLDAVGLAKAAKIQADDHAPPADLRVVHLEKPGTVPPPIATAVPVREPTSEELAALSRPVPSEPLETARTGSPEEADALFSSAFDKLRTGELVRAASEFQEFARRFPRHPAADNALLDEGIAFYGLREYQQSLTTFRGLIKRYPAGDAVPEAMYREADCAEKLGHPDEARTLLRRLKESYPQSAEAVQADRRLSELATNEGEN
jgi:tol-pal system protein YbgF